MNIEIERKFLVSDRSCIRASTHHVEILQAYIFIEKKRVLRVRKIDDKCILSIKIGINNTKRLEFEYLIPKEDANVLIKSSDFPIIEKNRYFIKSEDRYIWEVDVFKGENLGLIVAELELENESDKIIKPDWLGEEVTADERYLNYNLSKLPYSQWT